MSNFGDAETPPEGSRVASLGVLPRSERLNLGGSGNTAPQFRPADEQTAHVVYITDADGTIEYVNEAFEDITGYTEEEATGLNPRILKSGVYDDAYYQEMWETIQTGEQWHHEIIDERADGSTIVLDQTISPITDADGEPRQFVAVARDATERNDYEQALQRTRARLRQIIDLVPDLIFVQNQSGEYLLVNEATAEVYGANSSDIEGVLETDLASHLPESERLFDNAVGVADLDGTIHEFEETVTTAHGDTRTYHTTMIPYNVAQSSEKAVLGYARDITDRKEYERQLETQRDNLELLNQVVRHDIRNDLQLIRSHAELLAEQVSNDAADHVASINESAENAVALTRSARDLALVMLQPHVENDTVASKPVIEDEISEIRGSYPDAAVHVEGEIPAIDVVANSMLDSVLRNILGNAIQHNPADHPTVTVSVHADDETLTIRAADDGVGVPDEQKDAIFGHGEKGLESEGTGIGLYLVQRLVDSYDGAVWVEDNDPEGAVFVVELRIAT